METRHSVRPHPLIVGLCPHCRHYAEHEDAHGLCCVKGHLLTAPAPTDTNRCRDYRGVSNGHRR